MPKWIRDLLVGSVAVAVVLAVLLLPLGLSLAEGVDGKALYEKKCAMCHGKEGAPPEMWAKKGVVNFSDKAWQDANSDDAILKATAAGIPDKNMPAYEGKMSEEEIGAVVKHIRTLLSPR